MKKFTFAILILFVALTMLACSRPSEAVAIALAERKGEGKLLWSAPTDGGYTVGVCNSDDNVVLVSVTGDPAKPTVNLWSKKDNFMVCGKKAAFWGEYQKAKEAGDHTVEDSMSDLQVHLRRYAE